MQRLVNGIIRQTVQLCTFGRFFLFSLPCCLMLLPRLKLVLLRLATNVPELSARAMHPMTTLVLLPLACRILLDSATKYQPVQPFELYLLFFLPRLQSLEHAKLATTVPEALARPMPTKTTQYDMLKSALFSDLCNQTSGLLTFGWRMLLLCRNGKGLNMKKPSSFVSELSARLMPHDDYSISPD